MKRIAILGCENSHANGFLKAIKENEKYNDVEVVGVYSTERDASLKLQNEFGVNVLNSPEECVGKIDGLIITARHGYYHYKWAKLFMESGIPMFLDKPITITEKDAQELYTSLKANNVKVCGGSILGGATYIKELAAIVAEKGATGGYFKAPVNLDNPHGDFFFYAEHLVAMMCAVFGFYPESVYAKRGENTIDCIVNYGDKNVHLCYTANCWKYHALVTNKEGVFSGEVLTPGYTGEFDEFYELMGDGKSRDYADLVAPVYIMNAINRSIISGKEEPVNKLNK